MREPVLEQVASLEAVLDFEEPLVVVAEQFGVEELVARD